MRRSLGPGPFAATLRRETGPDQRGSSGARTFTGESEVQGSESPRAAGLELRRFLQFGV
jgi:hypothetical protein